MIFPTNFPDILNYRGATEVSNDTKSIKGARLLDKKVAEKEDVGQQLFNGTEFLFFKMFSFEN